MLLCLGMAEFPVDVNVGRICSRLGWIPLDAEEALEVRGSAHQSPHTALLLTCMCTTSACRCCLCSIHHDAALQASISSLAPSAAHRTLYAVF